MLLRIMYQDHFEIIGEGSVLLTAPHAGGPDADLLTGEIAEEAAVRAKCYAIIGKMSREKIDLNRAAATETGFREGISRLLENHEIRCILDIHGKEGPGVEIGTAMGEAASVPTIDLVRGCLTRDFSVKIDEKYPGLKPGSIITTYTRKDNHGHFATEGLQLEFGLPERRYLRQKAVDNIAEIVDLINKRLSGKEQTYIRS